jgi:rhodanese-related sulfurtransferase
MINSISATELVKLIASGKSIDLIDVRTPVEYREVHVAIARNQPLDRLDPDAIQSARNGSANEPLYVVCRSGSRSRQACEKFLAAGVTNIVNVDGGTNACVVAGASVVRGKKAIPLNCQVQIITGLAILAGTAAAILSENLYWLAAPLAMGAGLLYSGLTNTCAMGTALARMQWNRLPSESATSATSAPAVAASTPKACTGNATGCCN